jgi:glutamyl-tRNA synthetase
MDDIVRQARPYLLDAVEFDADAIARQWKDAGQSRALLTAARSTLAAHDGWDAASLEPALRGVAEAHGVGAGKLMQPLRVALTGVAASPGIFDVLELLGRDRSLARIDAALAHPHLAAPT